jgi:hypothetical protein
MEKGGEWPVQGPSLYECGINLDTAKTMGPAVPHSLLVIIEDIVQRSPAFGNTDSSVAAIKVSVRRIPELTFGTLDCSIRYRTSGARIPASPRYVWLIANAHKT